jgi:hypothetical protein
MAAGCRNPLVVSIPEEWIERVAERAAALVVEQLAVASETSPWLSGARAAAEYLGWPTERVYKNLSDLPHYRHGSRLMFRREELDRCIEQRGGRR